jgi:hypothetical protein
MTLSYQEENRYMGIVHAVHNKMEEGWKIYGEGQVAEDRKTVVNDCARWWKAYDVNFYISIWSCTRVGPDQKYSKGRKFL